MPHTCNPGSLREAAVSCQTRRHLGSRSWGPGPNKTGPDSLPECLLDAVSAGEELGSSTHSVHRCNPTHTHTHTHTPLFCVPVAPEEQRELSSGRESSSKLTPLCPPSFSEGAGGKDRQSRLVPRGPSSGGAHVTSVHWVRRGPRSGESRIHRARCPPGAPGRAVLLCPHHREEGGLGGDLQELREVVWLTPASPRPCRVSPAALRPLLPPWAGPDPR